MLAYDADEMIGKQTPLMLHLPSEIEARERELSASCGRPIQGFNVLVEEVRRGTHEECEWTYLRKDGQHIPVTLLVTAMRDVSGYITGYLGIAKDLTESKRAEAALRDSEERLRLAADAAGVAVWDWDIRSGVITWDAGIFAMYGVPPTPNGQVKYEDWSTKVHPDDLAEQEAHLRHIVSSRGRGRREFRIVRGSDQAVRIIHAAETVLVGRDGHTIRVVGINIDITEQKTAQLKLEQAALEMEARNLELAENRDRALAATKAKSEFLATMSHEIRTPMNAITGMADLLQETTLSQVQQEYVDRFSRAANSLLDLINDILDLSKIEAGHVELESIPFDLHDLIDKTAESMAVRAHAKHIELIAFVHPDVPTCVVGDPIRLRQVLINLAGNAVKFTERGEVTLTVAGANDHAMPDHLRFSITDTGIGIPEDKVNTIFESFTQVDSSTTRKYGGTGLGLSISKRIVELMGSHIEVKSVVERGSTFSFMLHLAKAPPPGSQQTSPESNIQGRRILVVDDNDTHRMIVREHLSREGALIIESPDAASALAALDLARQRDEPIHLVILDCLLPDRHGMELAHAIRQRPEGAAIPLLIHTAEVRRATARRADQLNIAGYIYKPISRKRLLASVSAALRQSSIASLAQQPIATQPVPADQPPLAILLVEDLEDNRDLIELFLKGLPYRLDMAENGAVGLQKFQSGTYNLVLMDIQMPVMDGYQATNAIRTWERAQRREMTPIIALSANAFKEDIDKSLDAGCNAHLTKPIKKQTLLEAICRYAGMNPRKEAA
jgi:PAS domain S-box-containing protein